MKEVRILIADDHEVVRQGLRAVLEQQAGWCVCGEATTGREAVTKAIDLRPDVVILDVTMPELNGVEATRRIRRASAAKVLILTMHDSDELRTELFDAGAHGWVLKSYAGRTLIDAVKAMSQSVGLFGEGVRVDATQQPGVPRAARPTRSSGRLTPRQREVLQLLAEAKSNKEIAALLGTTTKTAETHRAQIMAKLNLHSMSELVRYAIRNHIIEA